MRIDTDIKLDFKDVLIRPKRSTLKSRAQVDLNRTYNFRNSKREWTGVPIIAANMDTVGTFEMAIALGAERVVTAIHKHYSTEQWADFAKKNPKLLDYVAVSSGVSEEDFKKLTDILAATKVTFICLDVANGYSEHFVSFVRRCREAYPKHTIMAGNVVTGEMVEELILSGADIVKVGIGPGSVCTTRKKTGVGYPQLSAVIECADAAHGLGGLIIADGGCTNPGDIVKAFGGGADFVMIGGMLAGHDESDGTVVDINGQKFKEFYGMSSATAMKKHSGKVAEYRASEGKHVLVPYRGPVKATIEDILGGLRSACTYVGAGVLKDLSKRTTFIRVTQQTNEVFAGVPAPSQTAHEERKVVSGSSNSNSNSKSSSKSTPMDTAEDLVTVDVPEDDTDSKDSSSSNSNGATKSKSGGKGKAARLSEEAALTGSAGSKRKREDKGEKPNTRRKT
jgi:GMP reductase